MIKKRCPSDITSVRHRHIHILKTLFTLATLVLALFVYFHHNRRFFLIVVRPVGPAALQLMFRVILII